MINKKSIDHISNYRVTPPDRTWDKLKLKLDKRRARRKISFYRNISIAASIIALVCFFYVLSENIPMKKNTTFATNHLYKPAILEELPQIEKDHFYSIEKLIHYDEFGYQFSEE
jgi:hypothetical protein